MEWLVKDIWAGSNEKNEWNTEVKEMGLFKKKVLVQTYDKENKKPIIKSSY